MVQLCNSRSVGLPSSRRRRLPAKFAKTFSSPAAMCRKQTTLRRSMNRSNWSPCKLPPSGDGIPRGTFAHPNQGEGSPVKHTKGTKSADLWPWQGGSVIYGRPLIQKSSWADFSQYHFMILCRSITCCVIGSDTLKSQHAKKGRRRWRKREISREYIQVWLLSCVPF